MVTMYKYTIHPLEDIRRIHIVYLALDLRKLLTRCQIQDYYFT